MIQQITISNCGPHRRTTVELSLTGATLIRGRSQAGKSTVVDAVIWCLHGVAANGRKPAPSFFRDDLGDESSVSIRLSTGTVLTRRVNLRAAKRAERRELQRATGEITAYPTEEAWRAALRGLAADAEAVRLVVAPFAWLELAAGPGGGRPLRDVLARLGARDVDDRALVAELFALAGGELRDADPLTLAAAEEARRAAGVAETEARARLDEREAQRAARLAAHVDVVDPGDLERAQAVMHAGSAWSDYDVKCENYRLNVIRRDHEQVQADRWRDRLAALGERPVDVVAPLTAERDRLGAAYRDARLAVTTAERDRDQRRDAVVGAARAADAAITRASDALHRAAQAHDAARGALEQLAAEPVADVCPCCRRPGWDGAAVERAERVTAAQAAVDAAAGAVMDAHAERDRVHADTEAGAAARTQAGAEASQALARAEAAAAEAAAALEVARAAEAEALARPNAAAWDRSRAALGPCPSVSALAAPPVAPPIMRPTADEVTGAMNLIGRASVAAGAAAERARVLASLDVAIDTGRAALEAQRAERERLNLLVDVCRAAPSERARRQLAALGDLGPIGIDLLPGGGVDVTLDGIPFGAGSRGRQIVGDAWLRAGVRRALGVGALPIFVDGIESVGGQDVPRFAPTVWLETTHDDFEVIRDV